MTDKGEETISEFSDFMKSLSIFREIFGLPIGIAKFGRSRRVTTLALFAANLTLAFGCVISVEYWLWVTDEYLDYFSIQFLVVMATFQVTLVCYPMTLLGYGCVGRGVLKLFSTTDRIENVCRRAKLCPNFLKFRKKAALCFLSHVAVPPLMNLIVVLHIQGFTLFNVCMCIVSEISLRLPVCQFIHFLMFSKMMLRTVRRRTPPRLLMEYGAATEALGSREKRNFSLRTVGQYAKYEQYLYKRNIRSSWLVLTIMDSFLEELWSVYGFLIILYVLFSVSRIIFHVKSAVFPNAFTSIKLNCCSLVIQFLFLMSLFVQCEDTVNQVCYNC